MGCWMESMVWSKNVIDALQHAYIYSYVYIHIYIYCIYTCMLFIYIYIYIPSCSMMSFSSMSWMIFAFLPCFGRLNEAWCRLGLVGPGFEAELENEQISFNLKGGAMVASYGFSHKHCLPQFSFWYWYVVTWQGTSPHDLDRNTEGLSPLEVLTSSHSWWHPACSPWPSKCVSAQFYVPIPKALLWMFTQKKVHSIIPCGYQNPINSPTFLHPWLFENLESLRFFGFT